MELPKDIMRYLLEFLDDENLVKACMSSPMFSKRICNTAFWLKKIKDRFPELISPEYTGNSYNYRYKGNNTYRAYYNNISQLLNTDDSNKLFVESALTGRADIIRILIKDKRVDPSYDDNDAIRGASYYGHVEVIKLLLNDGRTDPSSNYNQAIRFASEKGYTEITNLLLNDGRADPSSDYNQAIRYASQKGYTKVMKLLLDDGRCCYNPCMNTTTT